MPLYLILFFALSAIVGWFWLCTHRFALRPGQLIASICSQLTIIVFVFFLMTSPFFVAAIATFLTPFTILVLPLVVTQGLLMLWSLLWPSLLISCAISLVLTLVLCRARPPFRQYFLLGCFFLTLPPFLILSDAASARAMCASALDIGVTTIYRHSFVYSLRNSAFMNYGSDSWTRQPHATLEIDGTTLQWSYRKAAWVPMRAHGLLPTRLWHACVD
jgi:hypothetical protein